MKAIPYSKDWADAWNDAVRASRNGTFLFERGFMDYHAHRFEDCSLVFLNEREEIAGLLPANLRQEDGTVQSHGGLTYGGLILPPAATLAEVRDMFKAAAGTYREQGAKRMVYKPTPYIYHRYPSEEDLYWLFRADARLEARTVSTTIDLADGIHTRLWRRKMKKNACEGLEIIDGDKSHLAEFWKIVEEVLSTRHATRPVHNIEEITLLARRHPGNICLHTVCHEKRVITGCLAFIAPPTVHIQYMESGEEGRRRRSLDFLIRHLIAHYQEAGFRYLDFGISTENGGQYLNEGLAYQKEGFGGRAVCYDIYSVNLDNLLAL